MQRPLRYASPIENRGIVKPVLITVRASEWRYIVCEHWAQCLSQIGVILTGGHRIRVRYVPEYDEIDVYIGD